MKSYPRFEKIRKSEIRKSEKSGIRKNLEIEPATRKFKNSEIGKIRNSEKFGNCTAVPRFESLRPRDRTRGSQKFGNRKNHEIVPATRKFGNRKKSGIRKSEKSKKFG